MPLSICIPATATSAWAMDDAPGLSASDPSPVVREVDLQAVGRVETIQLSLPPMSGQLSPGSPRTVAFEDLGDSSGPLSPNRVKAGRSQEVPEDGSLFNVSPVLTLPVYTLPSGISYMPGQSSVQTVLASGASSRPEGWSSATAQIADIAREGPFDAFASPMDMVDSPLVTTRLPGRPYRITSYIMGRQSLI